MNAKRLKFSAVLVLGLCLMEMQAQEGMVTIGGNASGNQGSVSFSIGQVFYTTNVGSNGSVAEGVQQPYEISVITALEEAKDISLMASAYPNPTADQLTLEIKGILITDMYYQIYDLQGNLMATQKITEMHTSVLMGGLLSATYFLKIMKRNKEIKTFKIIKIN